MLKRLLLLNLVGFVVIGAIVYYYISMTKEEEEFFVIINKNYRIIWLFII